MAELADIRAGIAANLATLNDPGIEVEEDEFLSMQVSAYSLASPNLPAIMVTGIETVDYKVAFRQGGVTFNAVVQAFVSESTDESPQRILDQLLLGEHSVKTLLETDKTFGVTGLDSFVTVQSGHKVFKLLNSQYLGAEWTVEIILDNDS
jgi:hypothetical protein